MKNVAAQLQFESSSLQPVVFDQSASVTLPEGVDDGVDSGVQAVGGAGCAGVPGVVGGPFGGGFSVSGQ